MNSSHQLSDLAGFSDALFEKMKLISPALRSLEFYEFQYCLDNLTPKNGWDSISLESKDEIEQRITDIEFYKNIQINHKVNGQVVLDPQIIRLAQMLFVGLVTGAYEPAWVLTHFYFDPRGFLLFTQNDLLHRKCVGSFSRKTLCELRAETKEFRALPGGWVQGIQRGKC